MNCERAQPSSTAKDDEFAPQAEEWRHLELMCNNSTLLGLGKSILNPLLSKGVSDMSGQVCVMEVM